MSKPLQSAVQETTQEIRDDSVTSKLADRCKHIYAAYNAHVINLRDMTYALMQIQIAQIADGSVRANHTVPVRPGRPDKKASTDAWKTYYNKLQSHETAKSLNYEAVEQVKAIRAFDMDLREAADRVEKGEAQEGDDYDYTKAKEWGEYIVNGGAIPAVRKTLVY